MDILIAFGSTEGHTRKIAHHINTTVQKDGHSCTLHDCGTPDTAPDPMEFDAIIVAGSVHQERHQTGVVDYVKTNLFALDAKPSTFISVSLSASLEDGKAEAQKYVDQFIEDTGWKPRDSHLAAGAIRFLEYDFFKRFTIQYMVLKGGNMPDQSAGNPEYTDWNALDAHVNALLERAASA